MHRFILIIFSKSLVFFNPILKGVGVGKVPKSDTHPLKSSKLPEKTEMEENGSAVTRILESYILTQNFKNIVFPNFQLSQAASQAISKEDQSGQNAPKFKKNRISWSPFFMLDLQKGTSRRQALKNDINMISQFELFHLKIRHPSGRKF